MTKKVSTIKKPDYRCKDCFYAIPDMTNLSIKTQEPILGSCRFQPYKILLNETACNENFKKRND